MSNNETTKESQEEMNDLMRALVKAVEYARQNTINTISPVEAANIKNHHLIIPEGQTSIPKMEYFRWDYFNSLCFSDTLEIGEQAFRASRLTGVLDMSNTQITHIGAGAFSDCNGIIKVIFPPSLVHLGEYAFSFCENLTTIEGLSSEQKTKAFSDNVFKGCSNLEE